MKHSEIISKVMFDWAELHEAEIEKLTYSLPSKLLRWLGAHHPDNKTRKLFFKLTNVSIGKDTVINQNFIVSDDYEPLLSIGERVAISPNVTVICASAPNNSLLKDHSYVKDNLICHKNVVIENDVWVGANVVILPGVTIGEKSIIGAGAVVSKDVNPYSVCAGNPAKILRKL